MSPKNDNQEPEAKADVTVDIPHDEKETPPAPATAPPLPVPEPEPLPTRPINITDNVSTPPPASPDVPTVPAYEFHEHRDRRWPIALLYIVLAFLVAAAIVFAGRWVYKKVTDNNAKPAGPTPTQQTQGQGSAPAAPPTGPSSNNSAGRGNQNVPVATGGQLPNNGPGDVVAIFVGTALAVGGLHFLYNLRKQN